MGSWKTNTHPFKWNKETHKAAGKKPSRTVSKLGRTYLAIPPAGGWPGGEPERNGWKHSGGK
jgi:hypothetical protein